MAYKPRPEEIILTDDTIVCYGRETIEQLQEMRWRREYFKKWLYRECFGIHRKVWMEQCWERHNIPWRNMASRAAYRAQDRSAIGSGIFCISYMESSRGFWLGCDRNRLLQRWELFLLDQNNLVRLAYERAGEEKWYRVNDAFLHTILVCWKAF